MSSGDEGIVYTPRLREVLHWSATVAMAAFVGAPSACAVILIEMTDIPQRLQGAVAGIAAAVTLGLFFVGLNYLPLLGNEYLRRRVERKIVEQEGGEQFIEKAAFVGFSPTEQLMRWSGESDWDVGFLAIQGDVIAYWGDKGRWSLPRQAVQEVTHDEQAGMSRVLIGWQADGQIGTAAIVSRHARSMAAVRANNEALAQLIQAWRQQGDGAPGPRWGLPPAVADGGIAIGQVSGWGCMGALAVLGIGITTWLLVGLPAYNSGMGIVAWLEGVAIIAPALVVASELLTAEVK